MQSMSLVSQEPMILNESLRANITYGLKREVTDEAIYQALEYGQLREWVKRLPEGLDTVVGERGVQMSGGEKQRLALTRAFIKKADIIILDEATSALDTKTERRIQDAMDEVIQGRTAIVIAHRLSTIVSADHLVVIEEGHVVEQGSFDELMAKRGIFYGYWDAQKNAKLTIASEITHNT